MSWKGQSIVVRDAVRRMFLPNGRRERSIRGVAHNGGCVAITEWYTVGLWNREPPVFLWLRQFQKSHRRLWKSLWNLIPKRFRWRPCGYPRSNYRKWSSQSFFSNPLVVAFEITSILKKFGVIPSQDRFSADSIRVKNFLVMFLLFVIPERFLRLQKDTAKKGWIFYL